MRAHGVVLDQPLVDDVLNLQDRVVDLVPEQLALHRAVEAFGVPVLPGAGLGDEHATNALLAQPVQQRVGDELAAVVGADQHRFAVPLEQFRQVGLDALGADAARHVRAQSHAGDGARRNSPGMLIEVPHSGRVSL